MIRRFYLDRKEDPTGTSGTGRIAEGCVFSNGWVAMTWLTAVTSVAFYPSIENIEHIHGHNGATVIVFEDPLILI